MVLQRQNSTRWTARYDKQLLDDSISIWGVEHLGEYYTVLRILGLLNHGACQFSVVNCGTVKHTHRDRSGTQASPAVED
ncbi:hypothetical protein WJX77_005911 [Trebouxia sp. C0004]